MDGAFVAPIDIYHPDYDAPPPGPVASDGHFGSRLQDVGVYAWNEEGESLFAPSLFVLDPAAARRPPLDACALHDAAERAFPRYAVNAIDVSRRADEPARFTLEARLGGPRRTTTRSRSIPPPGGGRRAPAR